MMTVALFGGFLFFLIGIVLSLIGSGGSILTIPVLVYVFRVEPYLATSYSMFLMGTSNWVAAIDSMRKKLILYKPGLYFAVAGLIVTYTIRRFVLPVLPTTFYTSDFFTLSKGSTIMIVFSVMMFVAAVRALKGRNAPGNDLPTSFNYKQLILHGAAVGLVTGFVGAGGGFLIIPALVFSAKIPMKNAVATSLLIISITTTLGFLGDFNPSIHIDWQFLLIYTGCAISGVLVANQYKDQFSNKFLRLLFGYLIFLLAVFVFIAEIQKLNISI